MPKKLAFDLQPDEKKEDRHQAVIDPEMDRHRPELGRQDHTGLGVELGRVGILKSAVGGNQRQRGRADQENAARRFTVEELPKG